MKIKKIKEFLKGEIKAMGDIFSGVASSSKRDRDGDTIDQSGWLLDDFKKNPVLLWGHNPYEPPVGKVMNIRQDGGFLKFEFAFASTPFAQELKTLVKEGFLNTFSVGFIPRDFGDESSGQATFTKSELLEISLVSIPSNTDAIVTSRAFKSLSEDTRKHILGEIKRSKAIVDHEERSFPISTAGWDEEAERRASEIADLKVMATFVDDDAPNDKSSYQLLHHTRAAEYPVVKVALDEAMKNLEKVPEAFREEAEAHLKAHYAELELEVPTKAVDEEKDVKPSGTSEQTVELSEEDRKLLKRVADGLYNVANGIVDPSLEAKAKVARKGRDESAAAYQRRVMIRALQKTAGTISKVLADKKKS